MKIKFRGRWEGQWVYGDYYHSNGIAYIKDPGAQKTALMRLQVDDSTVTQFSGLHDDYDMEVYVGDKLICVSHAQYMFHGTMVFDQEHLQFAIQDEMTGELFPVDKLDHIELDPCI